MGRTWGATEKDDYFYEVDINEAIERAHQQAYERAYQAQRRRESVLWERRNSDHG
jgi:hypothetical protein